MVVFRQRKTFLFVSAVVLLGAVLYAIAGTKYQATMKVLVRRGRAEAPVSAGENAPLDLTRMGVTEEELNSEVELLRDDEVLRKVIEETGAGGRDWLHILHLGEGRPQRVERAARRLAQRLNVDPVKKTNLIAIRYAASDPQEGVRILRSVATAYLEKHTAVHRPTGDLRFFEKETDESKQQLEDSERDVAAIYQQPFRCGGRAATGSRPAKTERAGYKREADKDRIVRNATESE